MFYAIPWEFCVCLAQERRLAFLVAVYEYVVNMPSRRKENGIYIPPGVTPSRRTLHPTALTRKLAFQCRCARVSETKLLYFIPCENHILMLCYDTRLNKFDDYVGSKGIVSKRTCVIYLSQLH